ncbi:MAG: hypothetical protein Tsb002_33810 [Wenzhouxiangellaceae bacterium]
MQIFKTCLLLVLLVLSVPALAAPITTAKFNEIMYGAGGSFAAPTGGRKYSDKSVGLTFPENMNADVSYFNDLKLFLDGDPTAMPPIPGQDTSFTTWSPRSDGNSVTQFVGFSGVDLIFVANTTSGELVDIIPAGRYALFPATAGRRYFQKTLSDGGVVLDDVAQNRALKRIKFDKWDTQLKKAMVSYPTASGRVYLCNTRCPNGNGIYNEAGAKVGDSTLKKLEPKSPSDLRLHVYDVGPGNCLLVECPNASKAMLVDCGSTDRARVRGVGEFKIGGVVEPVPQFLSPMFDVLKNVNVVDVVLTHGDEDHYNLLDFIFFKQYDGKPDMLAKIGNIYAGGNFLSYGIIRKKRTTGNQIVSTPVPVLADKLANLLPTSISAKLHAMGETNATPYKIKVIAGSPPVMTETPVQPITTSTSISCGGATTKILAINEGSNWSLTNPQSMVLSLKYPAGANEKKIILPGDATQEPLLKAKDLSEAKNIDILVAPHHGSAREGSDNQSWVDEAKPKYLILSHGNKHGHPAEVVYDKYASHMANDQNDHEIWFNNGSNTLPIVIRGDVKTRTASTFIDGDFVYTIDQNGQITSNCYGPWTDRVTFNVWCSPDLVP